MTTGPTTTAAMTFATKRPSPRVSMASGFNPRAGRTGMNFGLQRGATVAPNANMASVQTSITPAPVYTPAMTTGAVSNAVAEQHQSMNPETMMKQFDRPGASRDAGSLYAISPGMAGADIAARQAKAIIPLDDMFTNQENVLRGQVARDREGLGQANLAARLWRNILNRDQSLDEIFTRRAGSGVDLFNSLMPSFGG